MKKFLLALAVLLTVSTVPVDDGHSAVYFSYTHRAIFAHYAHNNSWWTGLGILNTSGSDITVWVVADGNPSEASGAIILDAGEKAVGQLHNLCTSGTVPSSGVIYIYGDGPFLVSKFTANTLMTPGFSEIQLTPISAPGSVLIGAQLR